MDQPVTNQSTGAATGSLGSQLRARTGKRKNPRRMTPSGASFQEPGSDLLLHGRRPHYHRRRAFSLPSSKRDRVVPARYGRQANRLTLPLSRDMKKIELGMTSVSQSRGHRADSRQRPRTESRPIGCYMVKPHGQLVLVSSMHYCTYTPSLSTS